MKYWCLTHKFHFTVIILCWSHLQVQICFTISIIYWICLAPFYTPLNKTPRIHTVQHERHSFGKYYAAFEVQDCWSFDKEMHDNSRASTVQGAFNVHPCNHVCSKQGQEISVFSTKSRPAVEPTQHSVHIVQRVLWLGYVADSLPPFNAKVKNAWSYTSTTPLASQYGV